MILLASLVAATTSTISAAQMVHRFISGAITANKIYKNIKDKE